MVVVIICGHLGYRYIITAFTGFSRPRYIRVVHRTPANEPIITGLHTKPLPRDRCWLLSTHNICTLYQYNYKISKQLTYTPSFYTVVHQLLCLIFEFTWLWHIYFIVLHWYRHYSNTFSLYIIFIITISKFPLESQSNRDNGPHCTSTDYHTAHRGSIFASSIYFPSLLDFLVLCLLYQVYIILYTHISTTVVWKRYT